MLLLGECCAHFSDHPQLLVGALGRRIGKAALGTSVTQLSTPSCLELSHIRQPSTLAQAQLPHPELGCEADLICRLSPSVGASGTKSQPLAHWQKLATTGS